jgi:ubiquinone biosynthesis protein UbiJ
LTPLLKPIELALNTALSQDSETQAKLDLFEQRRIKIHISDIKQTISLSFEKRQLALLSESEMPADLTITAKAVSLAKLAQDPENLFSADIDINGDVQFAKQLRDLLEGFDFDWEAQLAKVTGDTLAYPIAHALRKTGSWLKSSHSSLQLTTAEYLKEEIRLLPDKSQTSTYMNQIDTLRADIDRLEARINRL